MKVFAAIARSSKSPFCVEECELVSPAADEVRVRVRACGICHTDSAAKQQHLPVPFPQTLGHEGAGVIEEVGNEVTGFAPGDHVVMTFGSCGRCEYCCSAQPAYCDDFLAINIAGKRTGGAPLLQNGHPVGQHFFAAGGLRHSCHCDQTQSGQGRRQSSIGASCPFGMWNPDRHGHGAECAEAGCRDGHRGVWGGCCRDGCDYCGADRRL